MAITASVTPDHTGSGIATGCDTSSGSWWESPTARARASSNTSSGRRGRGSVCGIGCRAVIAGAGIVTTIDGSNIRSLP